MPKPARPSKYEPMTRRLARLADAYCRATGLARPTLSSRLFGSGIVLDDIAKGTRDLNTGTYERVVRQLSMDWPDDLPWPANIERITATEAA